MRTLSVISSIIGVIAGIGIIVILGWKLHWWFYKANLNQQYQGNITSQEYQGAMVNQADDQLKGIQTSDDPGQAKALELSFCSTYSKLTPVSVTGNPDLAAAAVKYCPPA